MRNGDAYKIKSLSQQGVSDSDIFKRFRSYSKEEIKKFLPAKPAAAVAKPADEAPPKKKTRTRAKRT